MMCLVCPEGIPLKHNIYGDVSLLELFVFVLSQHLVTTLWYFVLKGIGYFQVFVYSMDLKWHHEP